MPHPPKKSKTSKRTKAINRLRFSKQRQRKKDEFAKLTYLQSQLDQYGNPLDLMNTTEELLNYEQKLVTRLIRRLIVIDKNILAQFFYKIYDEDNIDKLIKQYYANKENKSWSDILFETTYRCFGILNLNHLLTTKIHEYLEYDLDNHTEPVGLELNKEILVNIFKECTADLDITKKINVSEIINTCLLIYTQNTKVCIIEDDKMYGGGGVDNLRDSFWYDMFGLARAIVMVIIMFSVVYIPYYMAGYTGPEYIGFIIEAMFRV